MQYSILKLKTLAASFLFIFFCPVFSLQPGDLLFQNLDCGPLCDAIEEVTNGYKGNKFSHIGLVYIKADTTWIIEAIGKEVHLTPVKEFLQRSSHPVFIGRVKKQYHSLIPGALTFALQQTGVPYDDVFLYNNGKYYCSELIYDAFKCSNHNKPFFQLAPMTFKKPGSKEFNPVWVKYYNKLNAPIPEGMPGCNPGGLSRSNKIEIIGEERFERE